MGGISYWNVSKNKTQSERKSQVTMITPDFSGKPSYAVTDAVTELLRVHGKASDRYRS